MLPRIWIFDTYSIMLFIGVAVCLYVFYYYHKVNNSNKKYIYDLLLAGIAAIIVGLISAVCFQALFDHLKENSDNGPLSMTFYGGLVGGAGAFLIIYFAIIKRKYKESRFLEDILIPAPMGIAIAHAFGRIGCFMAGCCYGIETDSWLGVKFPNLEHNVYPTQLFEAIFLFLLFGLLAYFAFKRKSKYTLSIYLISYGIWRFLIEFIRGDDRGAYFLSLSPSQWFSIVALIIGALLAIILKKCLKNKEAHEK